MIWGDSLADSRVIPISFAPGPEGICTVEALATYSAIQIVSLACRICQLPDFLVDAVAELETTLWVNEARCFSLDPDAARQADTARLIGHGLAHFLSQPTGSVPSSPASGSSGSSRAFQQFVTDLAALEDAPGSHFAVFAEPHLVFVLPIPVGGTGVQRLSAMP